MDRTPRPSAATAPPGAATDAAAGPDDGAPATAPGAVLALVCLGQFLVVLDISIVNVALPSVQGDLGFSGAGLQWVVNAYTIAFAGFLLLGGRLADLAGHRRTFVVGLSLFAAASLLGGLATTQGMLVGARAVQGLGAAVLAPATLTILTSTFPEGPERAKALGLWAAVGAGGGAAGSVVGGLLTETLSWRWVLLVNLPVGIAAVVVALRLLAPDRRARTGERRRLDLPGAVGLTAGLGLFVFGVVQSEQHGWGSLATLGPALGGLALVAATLAYEGALARDPLLPLGLFRLRGIAAANLAILLVAGGSFSMWYFLSLYMQDVLGYGALETGLGFLPHTAAIVVASQVTSRRLARHDPHLVVGAGSLVVAVGFLWQSLAPADGTYLVDVLGPGLVICTGTGLVFAPITGVATAGVPAALTGLASGVLNTARQLGAAVGLAVLVTLAADRTAARAGAGDGRLEALAAGYDRAFLLAAGLLGVAALVALLLPRRDGPGPGGEAQAGDAGPAAAPRGAAVAAD